MKGWGDIFEKTEEVEEEEKGKDKSEKNLCKY